MSIEATLPNGGRILRAVGILLWLLLACFFVLLGALLASVIRSGRQLPDSKPSDLERADDDPPTRLRMLGRYWPGPW